MKSRRLLSILGLSVCAATAPALARGESRASALQTENREVNLSVGENQTLPAADIKSYSEGNEGIVEVRLTPESKDFVVVGKKPGATTLLMIKRNGDQLLYSIQVFARPMELVQGELTKLLVGYTGLRTRRIGPRIFIEGGVSSQAEVDRLKQIASLYPGQVESLVVLGGAAADRRNNIRLDMYFVQFSKNRTFGVGVVPPTGLRANFNGVFDFLASRWTSAQATVSNQALPGLDFAAANGWAKIMRHSTVITSNGSEAEFNSGGEQNFRVTGGLAATIQSVSFGTKITVLPRFDPVTRELEIKLQAHVTDLTDAASGSDLPGRDITDLETQVSLKLGQSLILSGIQGKSQRHTITGLPLLSEIPFFGLFFGRHGDAREQTEGVMFLVPSVVEAMTRDRERLIGDLLQEYDDFSGKVLGDPHGLPGAR